MEDRNRAMAVSLAEKVAAAGGRAWYVGGFVRDRLRGQESKDLDIEVHGLAPTTLETILDSLGERMAVGESFGIYSLKGFDMDIAMPRREENRGRGHRDFDVFVDPFIGTYKAAVRRDFTINAMMEDVLTGGVVDHFGGQEDLKNGIIRHVNDGTFAEDPLRVLRAAQFAARFGFTVAPETVEICRQMDLAALPRERILGELSKALLKAESPSVFFKVLREMGQLRPWFAELADTIDIPQDPRWHAEGDVWTHSLLVLDAAASLRNNASDPVGFLLAALCHDFGKALCTEVAETGAVRSVNHEILGLPLIQSFLGRLTNEKDRTAYVLNLCEHHMRPNILAGQNASVKATNRLFDSSLDPEALLALAASDRMGQVSENPFPPAEDFLRERLALYREMMAAPYVMGRDLTEAGVHPSPRFKEYLELAHKLRLAGVKKDLALRQVLGEVRKNGELPQIDNKN